ncbi:MAG TPA: hypothetical protein VG820_07975, partial [Fimbriimonadaceae bacterium]|nr:hypothetical protein [Fimbriimonadaceae bacterium]
MLFTAGIGYVAFRYFDIPQASMQIDSAVEKYRKAGLPWEAKELAPKPPVRAEENAAPLIRKASSALDLKLFRSSYRRIAGELDNGKPDTAAADLAPFEKAMALGIEASKRPRVDFGRDWDMGVDLLFPEETTVRTLVHLLGFRAELRAQRGDITGMISDVRAALRLSNLPTQEPTGIPLLATVSSQRLVFASIQRCGDTLQRNPAALRDLSQALEQEYRKPSFADALPGEAYMMVATVRNLELRRENESGESIPIDPRNLRRTGAPSNPFARAFMTRALQEWTEAKPIIDRYRDRPQKLAKELVVLDA